MNNVGIVGVGYWGPNLVRTFNSIENVTVKYIADKDPNRREFIKSEFPNLDIVDDLNIILDDKDISIIVIVTPMESHYSIAKQALDAGKNIFVEKPFTVKSIHAKELIQIAEKNNLKIGVGHLFTFHPAIEQIQKFITSSKLNSYYINFNRANLRPPTAKYNVVWDLAVHDIAVANYLFSDFPIKVEYNTHDYSNQGLDDMAFIRLHYKLNKFANIHVGWHTPNKIRNFQLYGESHSIFFDDMSEKKVIIFDEGVDNRKRNQNDLNFKLSYGVGKVIHPIIPDIQPLYNECKAFVDYVNGVKSYKNSGDHGYWVVKICEQITGEIKIEK